MDQSQRLCLEKIGSIKFNKKERMTMSFGDLIILGLIIVMCIYSMWENLRSY